jgi:hypothetical protein
MNYLLTFLIVLWVLMLIVYELAIAHFEDFHGIEEGTDPSEALKIEKTFSIDGVIFIKILRIDFFVDLNKVRRRR